MAAMRNPLCRCSASRAVRNVYSTKISRPFLQPPSQHAAIALLPPARRAFHAASGPLRNSEGSSMSLNDFNVLGNTPAPATSVDVCLQDGFALNSGATITGGNGAILVDGEAFEWKPWEALGHKNLLNKKGQFDLPAEAFAVFDVLWPRPDLLIVGTGKSIAPLSPETRKAVSALGMRVEVLDTRNAAAQFNLLATERGVADVAAVLIPLGWKDGIGVEPPSSE